jgi:hypothetical protein
MKELPKFPQRWRSPPPLPESRWRRRGPLTAPPPPPADAPGPGADATAHCRRVAALAAAMGELLRVAAEDVARLQAAGLLHETGSATGPEPGREPAADPLVALLIERQHADYAALRADGSLGPRERLLTGILRVADLCDAAAGPRAFPERRRMETLERGAGTAFHPLAVHAMLRLEGRAEP